MEHKMTGAELASMEKSSVVFKSLDGVKCDELKLPEEDLAWWRDAKIGLFFHWGLYSIIGHGEWAMFNDKIPVEEYAKLAEEFNPQDFEMQELTSLARDFGAKYMVMVTRHHDGFALWDSPGSYGGFNSFNTASKRDFVKEYTDACRKEGLRVGLYYSPMDWRFPGYFNPEGLAENAALMKQQGYAQVEELCRNYGPVDILWYDGGWLAHKGTDASSAWFWEPVKLNEMVRKYQPKAVINPRSGWEGDFQCDEGSHEVKGGIIPIPWEKGMSITGAWSWRPQDTVFSYEKMIPMLVNVVCRDGNFLLNVGPDRNGKVPSEVAEVLKKTGLWLKSHGEAIYGTRGGPFEPVDRVFGATCKDNTIYLFILDRASFEELTLPPVESLITGAEVLGGPFLNFTQGSGGIKLSLPDDLPETLCTVVKLTLSEPVK